MVVWGEGDDDQHVSAGGLNNWGKRVNAPRRCRRLEVRGNLDEKTHEGIPSTFRRDRVVTRDWCTSASDTAGTKPPLLPRPAPK